MRLSASRVGLIDAAGALCGDVRGTVDAVRPAPVLLTAVTWCGAVMAAWKGYRAVRKAVPQGGKSPNPFRVAADQLLAVLLTSLALSLARLLAPGASASAGNESRRHTYSVFSEFLPRGFYRWLGLDK